MLRGIVSFTPYIIIVLLIILSCLS